MLNTYTPFEDKRKEAVSNLDSDHITVDGVDIAFLVSRGSIFLEILGSFTILGQLKLAMRNKWHQVDKILGERGVKQRDAFRRCYKSTVEKASYSQRYEI